MAKNNPGDLLTSDWNPVIGCEKYSTGCRLCWYMDGIFPWQQRLGNIPQNVAVNQVHVFSKRMDLANLKTKRGIVGIGQHGDLFWDKVPDATIHQVLDLVDQSATMKPRGAQRVIGPHQTKYILWSKRAERMINLLAARYNGVLPEYLACSVSAENQKLADERFPHFAKINGMKIAMMEPMLGPVDMGEYIDLVNWVVVVSETGIGATPIVLDWVRSVRDTAIKNQKCFFIKQLGTSHKSAVRTLDGRTWDEFPRGYVK